MVEIRNLTAGYGSTPVLSGIDLEFRPGEVLTILGPNGCGKSTLLRTVAGLNPILEGQVLIDGADLRTMKQQQAAKKVSYLAQNRAVPGITAERMVLHGRFPYLTYPRRYGKKDFEIVHEALRAVDAQDLANLRMDTLSGGQRQRIYIAMTLAQCTDTILLDEPTTFLDIHHRLELMKLARSLADKGKAVVTVLHDLPLSMKLSDRLAVISNGTLQALGTPGEILAGGVIDRVFSIRMREMDTPDGPQYYILKEDA